MATRNYLVEGLSGVGKSSVYEELIGRGYAAISTDRAWKREAGAGLAESTWDERRAVEELESVEPDVMFVCGSGAHRDRFLPYFTRVFNLRIDDDTMRRRLRERTNNDFGKRTEDLELMLERNRSGERPAGAVDVDATRPLDQVVDDVLRLANCPPRNDAAPTPWSKHRSATARSIVFDGNSITRSEYAWSGSVLATLLPYLEEQGIDIVGEATATVSQTDDRWVFVLTPDHRERYLARLDPSAFDSGLMRRYYEELNETAAKGVEYAMLDGIAFLRDTLAPLDTGIVAVLTIG